MLKNKINYFLKKSRKRYVFFLQNSIKCFNKTHENCNGEFVLNVDEICYFFYKTDKIYRNYEMNDLCLEKNQTEIDLTTKNPHQVILFFIYIFHPSTSRPEKIRMPLKFFCK